LLALFALKPVASPRVISAPTVRFSESGSRAKAAYVYDLREGKELFAKNADARLPLASVTKLMSALMSLLTSCRSMAQ
jgi:D-alanyl-D-alanine carboxypeptidase